MKKLVRISALVHFADQTTGVGLNPNPDLAPFVLCSSLPYLEELLFKDFEEQDVR